MLYRVGRRLSQMCMRDSGDVSGVIATSAQEAGVDIYMGTGGAPEGVLAAAALRCIGGQMQGRLVFRNDDERGRASRLGITEFDKKTYSGYMIRVFYHCIRRYSYIQYGLNEGPRRRKKCLRRILSIGITKKSQN